MANVTITPINRPDDSNQINDPKSPIKVKKEKKDDFETSITKIGNTTTSEPICIQLSNSISLTVTRTSNSQNSTPTPKPAKAKPLPPKPTPTVEEKPPPIDFSSIIGKFGWTTICHEHMPYIFRGEAMFVSVRMVEYKIIARYTSSLPWMAFACAKIKSFYVTENEQKLLNEINTYHCDYFYGKEPFTLKDVVVNLEDANKFCDFIKTCYAKIYSANTEQDLRDYFGFLKFQEIVLPYITKGDKKLIPIDLIKCMEHLKIPDAEHTVGQWDLPYFTFLANMNGEPESSQIQLDSKLCSIQMLSEINNGTIFYYEEWWPSAYATKPHHHKPNYNSFTLDTSSLEASQIRESDYSYLNSRDSLSNGSISMNPNLTVDQYGGLNLTTDNYSSNQTSLQFPPPPPLVRLGGNVNKPTTNGVSMPLGPPPPLHRRHSQNTDSYERSIANGSSYHDNLLLRGFVDKADEQSTVIQKNMYLNSLLNKDNREKTNSPRLGGGTNLNTTAPPYYPTPPQSSPLQNMSLPPMMSSNPFYSPSVNIMDLLNSKGGQDIIDLCSPPPSPDMRLSAQYNPYSFTNIEDKLIPCVNYNHRTSSQPMVSVFDVSSRLFPNIPYAMCLQGLQNNRIRLFDSTILHQHALTKNGGTSIPGDYLISVSDLKTNYNHIKSYLYKHYDATQPSPAKKQCFNNGILTSNYHLK